MDISALSSQPVFQDTVSFKKLDGQEGLKAVADQFEGLFLQMMMKSMRETSYAMMSEDSPFNSEHQKIFQEMMDAEMAQDMTHKTNLGLSDGIVRQLSKHVR